MADPGTIVAAVLTVCFVFFAAFILIWKCTNWRPPCCGCRKRKKDEENILPGPSGPRVDPPFFTPPAPYPFPVPPQPAPAPRPAAHPQHAPAPRPAAPARIATERVDHVYRSPPSTIPARKPVASSGAPGPSSGAPIPSSSSSSRAPEMAQVEDSPYAPYASYPPYAPYPARPVSPVSAGPMSPGVVSPVRMEFEDVPLEDSHQQPPGGNPKGYWGF